MFAIFISKIHSLKGEQNEASSSLEGSHVGGTGNVGFGDGIRKSARQSCIKEEYGARVERTAHNTGKIRKAYGATYFLKGRESLCMSTFELACG